MKKGLGLRSVIFVFVVTLGYQYCLNIECSFAVPYSSLDLHFCCDRSKYIQGPYLQMGENFHLTSFSIISRGFGSVV